MSIMCKCGHAEKWHNKPYTEGGANWAPVGCYYETEPERPTICGCPQFLVRVKADSRGDQTGRKLLGTP